MKEEHKDLPAARQRLRDMQQEMIGLENSVLTEETRSVRALVLFPAHSSPLSFVQIERLQAIGYSRGPLAQAWRPSRAVGEDGHRR